MTRLVAEKAGLRFLARFGFAPMLAMIVGLGLLVWGAGEPSAQEAAPVLTSSSPVFGECRTGYWSSNRNLDDQAGGASTTCFGSWKPVLGGGASLGLNARATGAAQRMEISRGRVREAYLRFDQGPWTARVGRQVIAWGRSDRISPTDNLSPRDYTALLADDDEQRQGLDAASLRYELSQAVSMTAIVARFEGDTLPKGTLPPNLVDTTRPGRSEYAIKLDRSGVGLDWSLSYYDGFDRTPRYRPELPIGSSPALSRSYEGNRTFGADLALPAGNWTIRGEAAVTLSDPTCTSCGGESRRTHKIVVGAERDIGESISLALQLYGVHRNNYRSPVVQPAALIPLYDGLDRLNSEFSKNDLGATARLSGRFLNDRLKLELGVLFHQPVGSNASYVLRPRTTYALSDHIKISAGADRFYGDTQSYFGARKKNGLSFVEAVFVLPF